MQIGFRFVNQHQLRLFTSTGWHFTLKMDSQDSHQFITCMQREAQVAREFAAEVVRMEMQTSKTQLKRM